MDTQKLQELLDREAIRGLRFTFAHGLDSQNWSLVESLMLEEVDTDFTVWGVPPQRASRHDFTNTFKVSLSREGLRTQHIFSNFRIVVNGDTATSKFYQYAQHYIQDFPGGEEFFLRAEYHDQMIRTNDGWKLSAVKLATVFYTTGNPGILASGS